LAFFEYGAPGRVSTHRFAWGRTPAALRRAGNPRIGEKKPTHQGWLFLKMARPEG
jgi:hypothetical protein